MTFSLPPRVAQTIQSVASRHGVSVGDLLGRGRTLKMVGARRAAIRAVRSLDWEPWRQGAENRPSTTLIGRWFGRDHTTVLSAIRSPCGGAGKSLGASDRSISDPQK